MAAITIECPHCGSKVETELGSDPVAGLFLATCEACDKRAWLKLNEDGTMQVGVPVATDKLGNVMEYDVCPTCKGVGVIAKDEARDVNRLKSYLLTPDLGIKRQGVALDTNGCAVLLNKLSKVDHCPYVWKGRQDLEYGAIIIQLYWNDVDAMANGLELLGVKIPETESD